MTLPPGKRQRRLILSDDEEPVVKTRRAPPRLFAGSVTAVREKKSINQPQTPKKPKPKVALKASPKSSPEKANGRVGREEKGSKSLHTFFRKATEEQRWARKDTTPSIVSEDGEAADAIEDDSLDEAFAELADDNGDENEVLDRRKPGESVLRNGKAVRNVVGSSQKFAKPSKPTLKEKVIAGHDVDALNRPWAERFAPISLEELAVHKKKVTDVQNWLNAVLEGRDQRRLLVLKGPAGSGKTTTVTLLSKAMKFDISEWRSPTVADVGPNSFSSQFDDFLNRGGAFGTLDVFSGVQALGDSATAAQADTRKRILLIEEFPSTITVSSSALASFRSVLLQYLAAAVPPRSAVFESSKSHLSSHPPIVLIISESLLTSATASTDSFTVHRLLGPDLCNHPYATILEFNPVAPTLVTKALELAIKKEARVSMRRRRPGQAVLKRLSELGDVRSAVNGLEFLCVRGDADSDWGGTTAAKSKNSNKGKSALTNMEKDSLELVTQREATLGIFHAVGKVVWNKREDPRITDPPKEPPPKPPGHLPEFDRPKVSQVETDELLNEIGTDVQTFTAALHENYILSTSGTHFTESASNCIDFLSESDILSPASRQTTRSSRGHYGTSGAITQAGGVDMLRQNEISFQVAVRGLLFSLPVPVTRASHPNGRKGDSFKMFYPASLKIWKPSEEIHDLISLETSRLTTSSLDGLGSASSTSAKAEGVESWKSRSLSFLPTTERGPRSDDPKPRVWAARDEVLLERLPYLARIKPSTDRSIRDIKKITQFTGLLLGADEEVDGENSEGVVDLSLADETTDRIASPRKRVGIVRADMLVRRRDMGTSLEEVAVEKLFIEEDDIEDG